MNEAYTRMKDRFAASAFRSRFRLNDDDRRYLAAKGWNVIRSQAQRIIRGIGCCWLGSFPCADMWSSKHSMARRPAAGGVWKNGTAFLPDMLSLNPKWIT